MPVKSLRFIIILANCWCIKKRFQVFYFFLSFFCLGFFVAPRGTASSSPKGRVQRYLCLSHPSLISTRFLFSFSFFLYFSLVICRLCNLYSSLFLSFSSFPFFLDSSSLLFFSFSPVPSLSLATASCMCWLDLYSVRSTLSSISLVSTAFFRFFNFSVLTVRAACFSSRFFSIASCFSLFLSSACFRLSCFFFSLSASFFFLFWSRFFWASSCFSLFFSSACFRFSSFFSSLSASFCSLFSCLSLARSSFFRRCSSLSC